LKAQQPASESDIRAQQEAINQAIAQAELRSDPYTSSDVKTAQAGVLQAAAALEIARVNRRDATLYAPFDGVIANKFLNEGALASPNTPIFSLVSREVEVSVGVEESAIGQIRDGQAVALSTAAYPGREFPAKVVSIAP